VKRPLKGLRDSIVNWPRGKQVIPFGSTWTMLVKVNNRFIIRLDFPFGVF
jgi:hypothetical protein